MKKTFIWLSSVLHLCVVWVKLIKNITGSADVLFPENLGHIKVFDLLRWTRAMVQRYKMCSNPAETHRKQRNRNTHTIIESPSDYVLYIYYLWRELISTCPRHIKGPFYLSIWKSHNYMKHVIPQDITSTIMRQEFGGDLETTLKHHGQTGNWTKLPVV